MGVEIQKIGIIPQLAIDSEGDVNWRPALLVALSAALCWGAVIFQFVSRRAKNYPAADLNWWIIILCGALGTLLIAILALTSISGNRSYRPGKSFRFNRTRQVGKKKYPIGRHIVMAIPFLAAGLGGFFRHGHTPSIHQMVAFLHSKAAFFLIPFGFYFFSMAILLPWSSLKFNNESNNKLNIETQNNFILKNLDHIGYNSENIDSLYIYQNFVGLISESSRRSNFIIIIDKNKLTIFSKWHFNWKNLIIYLNEIKKIGWKSTGRGDAYLILQKMNETFVSFHLPTSPTPDNEAGKFFGALLDALDQSLMRNESEPIAS